MLGALLVFAALADLRLEYVRESLTGSHYTYRQYLDGVPVAGSEVTSGTPLAGAPVRNAAATSENLAYVIVDGKPRLTRIEIVQPRPLERVAQYVDVATGEILRSDSLTFQARARVFTANPITKTNQPLHDQNDSPAAVPPHAYSEVDIDVQASDRLAGPHVQIVDIESPSRARADPRQPLLFDRSQPQFEEVNAYFHIDRAQRYLQSLGYTGARQIVPYAIEVDAHAANGTDNSYFIANGPIAGRGALFFGDGGTDDAEDSDLLVHEYAHAIQEWIAPGAFTGLPSGQPRAIAEGFGDYWAFSDTYAENLASGHDPFCFADWDARCGGDDPSQQCGYPVGAECLRRVDTPKTMNDYVRRESGGTEHVNGEIWSSALRAIFLALVERHGLERGKRIADTLVIESHFGTQPGATFASMARRMIAADRLLFGGAHTATICAAMAERLILPGECERTPRGELTYLPSSAADVAIPDNTGASITTSVFVADTRTIERLYVDVDIAHTARGDLQLVLIAPDGTRVTLYEPSLDRTANIRTTFGLDALPVQSLDVFTGRSAAGEWRLEITDRRPRDAGRLRGWKLIMQFAGDVPAETRPTSTGNRKHIPAVAHIAGALGTRFTSDVRLANPTSRDARVTLVFTPSAASGLETFSAVTVLVPAGHTVAFDDVVATLFRTSGTGSLEILGDGVVATSRTWTPSPGGGTVGQSIPALDTSQATNGFLIVAPLSSGRDSRANIGFTELAGGSGTVVVSVFRSDGHLLRQTTYEIAPFGHVQVPVDGAYAVLNVPTGSARIVAYASVVDNRTGDPSFFLAERSDREHAVVAPVISAPGALGTRWRSDVTITSIDGRQRVSLRFADQTREVVVEPMLTIPDVVASTFQREGLDVLTIIVPFGVVATSRTYTDGTYGQSIPFLDTARLIGPGERRHLLHVESSAAFRTNLGIYSLGGRANIRVTVFDAAGTAVSVRELELSGLIQFPLTMPLARGRVQVEMLSGVGRVAAYASVVDNVTGDPTFVISTR